MAHYFCLVTGNKFKDHHKVEVTIPTKYYTMRAEVANADMYAAIDALADKIDRQAKKHKEKISAHRG